MNSARPHPGQRFRARLPAIAATAALAVLVLLVTQVPYRLAEDLAPAGHAFGGQIAIARDTSVYFSFIRQGAAGHWLFRNNMTHLDHEGVFANSEWLLMGRVMGVFELSETELYQVWRWTGGVVFFLGFLALASEALDDLRQRLVALLMAAWGSGFNWVLDLSARAGWTRLDPYGALPEVALDTVWSAHPFSQILRNPHFALPHGLFLLAFALYFRGEKTGRAGWYWASAGVAWLEGLSRPYDLITLFAVIPAFVAVEAVAARSLPRRRTLLRITPLIVCAPALLYFAYVFGLHPVFKFWASQGEIGVTPFGWQLAGCGLALVLALVRVVRHRSRPFTSGERLLATWIVVLFGLLHAGRVVSSLHFSAQLAVPLVPPMILLGMGLFRRPAGSSEERPRPILAAALVVGNALGTPLLLARAIESGVSNPLNYVPTAEIEALRWLGARARESDVVLSDLKRGERLAEYVTARIALANWCVTPHAHELEERVRPVLLGEATRRQTRALLEEIRPRWIYVAGLGRDPLLYRIPGIEEAYRGSDVRIYSVRR